MPNPIVTAPADLTICLGGSTTLSATGTATTYSWNNGVSDGVSFTPTATAVYVVTGTGNHGCQSTDTVLVTISTSLALTFNVTNVSCSGVSDGAVQYTVVGGQAPYTIEINGNSPFVMSSNPSTSTGLPNGFVFNGIVTDANGCSTSATAPQITSPSQIMFELLAVKDTCEAGVGSVTYASVGGGTAPYQFADFFGSFGSSSTVYGPTGSFTFIVKDANGCSQSSSIFVPNITVPVSGGINGPYATCIDVPIQIEAYGGTIYHWTDAMGVEIENAAVATVNPQIPTYYYVSINFGSCSISDSVLVSIKTNCDSLADNIVITNNAFSPNGDGINDVVIFDIQNLLINNENTVYFINRWGDIVREYYNYDNVSNAWDGKSNTGNDLPDGTYFFIIEIPGVNYKATGWIQLVR